MFLKRRTFCAAEASLFSFETDYCNDKTPKSKTVQDISLKTSLYFKETFCQIQRYFNRSPNRNVYYICNLL